MRWLSHRIMTALGWRFQGALPEVPQMVVIGAPHTSNWDFFLFLGALHHFRVKVRFLAKRGLFRWPVGMVFRRLGGIPVGGSGGVVSEVEEVFASDPRVILVIAPEGTRSAAPRWKSGFLEIAERVDVPVVPAGIDAAGKTVVIGRPLDPALGRGEIIDRLRVFYQGMTGMKPELGSPVRLDEDVS